MNAKSKSLSTTEIKIFYRDFKVPKHIVSHMRQVANVALILAEKIDDNHPELNLDIGSLNTAALLHDILKLVDFKQIHFNNFKIKPSVKTQSFYLELITKYNKVGHAKAAAIELKKLGFNKVAMIISKHGYSSLIASKKSNRPNTLEEKILYYADKRVQFDQIVSLKDRIKDGQNRYFIKQNKKIPKSDLRIQKKLYELEGYLCHLANLTPSQIF